MVVLGRKILSEVLHVLPAPSTIISDPPPPPSSKRTSRTAAGGPKIFSHLTPISTSTFYVEIKYPLLTSIPQEIGKLANILATPENEVGFFKRAQKYGGHRNWRRSQQERIKGTTTTPYRGARRLYRSSKRDGCGGERDVHPLWASHLNQ